MKRPECRSKVVIVVAVFAMASFAWLSSIPAAANRNWQIQVVDPIGGYSSITVDSTNNIHISYSDWHSMAVKHASIGGGVWTNHTVDVGNSIDTSIAVDSKDHIHISYGLYENPMWNLKYATNAEGTWVNCTLDHGNVRGTSIAIDSNDRIHISYVGSYPDHSLKYVTNADGSWVNYTVDNEGYVSGLTSIAVDSDNKVHISYAYRGDILMYATNTGGDWSKYAVDSSGDAAFYSSIAVDVKDKVHVSYSSDNYTNRQFRLMYATNAGGSWSVKTIDENADSEVANCIALDTNGKVHISYCGAEACLKYANNAAGEWSTKTIDSSGYLVSRNAIAVDANNSVHIAYSCRMNKLSPDTLRYATNSNKGSGSVVTPFVIVGTVTIAAVAAVLLFFLQKRWRKPSTQVQGRLSQKPPTGRAG